MSVMGALGTNLNCATRLHRPYRDALRAIKSRGGSVGRPDEAKSLLAVLAPLSCHLNGKTYFSLGVNGEEMSEFLRLRHREGWPAKGRHTVRQGQARRGIQRTDGALRRRRVDPRRCLGCPWQRVRVPVREDVQTMSARYLRCVIREQIDRAESLRAAIPDRQRHAALERLAAACSAISTALKWPPCACVQWRAGAAWGH